MRNRRQSYTDQIRITVTDKITVTYLLLACFSLISIGYALSSLHTQTTVSRELVNTDVRAAALARDLQSDINRQEQLADLLTIRPNKEALDLLIEKTKSSLSAQKAFLEKLSAERQQHFNIHFSRYGNNLDEFLKLLPEKKKTADLLFKKTLRPEQQRLVEELRIFRDTQQEKIDRSLDQLVNNSDRAFRITLTLLLLGLVLSFPIGISLILQIHRSLRRLTDATQQIAEGNYDVNIETTARDEFGLLTREFIIMGHKLREYETLNLDASPLTRLPGNLVIQRRVEELLQKGVPFAHAFIDLDHFKAFNDRYGYQNGSDIIKMVGGMIERIVKLEGNPDDFVGHIGGDDYIFLTTPDKVESLAQKFINEFDKKIPEYYSEQDRQTGSFTGEDRFGVKRKFQIMTVSIAIVCSEMSNYESATAISYECARIKEHLKRLPGSNYMIDRRKGGS
ncbi:MAG: diguanylate cyclase [Desulfuromonadales bacterium]|nr:diguanylate cyclase [Desulfuromonadales bacterium]